MDIGKISNDDLKRKVFSKIVSTRKDVVQFSGEGIDTAVINSDGYVVLSSDPITGATKNLGKLAVHVSVNDIATEMAEPVGILLTILMPPGTDLKDLEEIIEDVQSECSKIGMDIVGGHTEITDAVNRILVLSTVIGKKGDLKRREVEVGDRVLVSKYIAMEGTSIIYHENEDEGRRILSKEDVVEVENLQNLLSVLPESIIARKHNVKLLHDITEGGVYGALHEIHRRIGMGMEIEKEKIPFLKSTLKIANHYNLNPYRLISSGSMLMIVDKNSTEDFIRECSSKNINLVDIGEITGDELILHGENGDEIITPPEKDELYKALRNIDKMVTI